MFQDSTCDSIWLINIKDFSRVMAKRPAEFAHILLINCIALPKAIIITTCCLLIWILLSSSFSSALSFSSFFCPHACRWEVEVPDLILVWLDPPSLISSLPSFPPFFFIFLRGIQLRGMQTSEHRGGIIIGLALCQKHLETIWVSAFSPFQCYLGICLHNNTFSQADRVGWFLNRIWDWLVNQSSSCWKEGLVHLCPGLCLLSTSKLSDLVAGLIGEAFSLVGGGVVGERRGSLIKILFCSCQTDNMNGILC